MKMEQNFDDGKFLCVVSLLFGDLSHIQPMYLILCSCALQTTIFQYIQDIWENCVVTDYPKLCLTVIFALCCSERAIRRRIIEVLEREGFAVAT